MTIFRSQDAEFVPPRDDVTLPQFLFDQHHPLGGEALHSRSPTYFIDDATGRRINGEEVRVCATRPSSSY